MKKVNYKILGSGEPIILIHGWGASMDSMKLLQQDLSKNFKAITLDLPGFGLSPEPQKIFGIQEYTAVILDLAKDLKIKKFHLFGHSFGGQIATNLTIQQPELVKSLIICNGAVVRTKSFKTRLIIRIAKIIKNFKLAMVLKSAARNSDYYKASPKMKQIMNKILNEDLTLQLPVIKIPTLLLWGEKDTYTPIWQGEMIHKLIPHSKLIVYQNYRHNIPVTHHQQLAKDIKEFVKSAKVIPAKAGI